MLHFVNGRFHCEGVSFALPREFYFDSYAYADEPFENGIRVWGKTRDYYLQFAISEASESTDAGLEELVCLSGGTIISDIEAIECQGLHGHQASYLYEDDNKQYFELRLVLPDDLQFALLIATKGDIQSLVQSEEIQDLIREIRAE